jgi:hypothetical protein
MPRDLQQQLTRIDLNGFSLLRSFLSMFGFFPSVIPKLPIGHHRQRASGATSLRGIKPSTIDPPRSGNGFIFFLPVTPPARTDFVLFCAPPGRIYINGRFIPRPIGTRRFYASRLPAHRSARLGDTEGQHLNQEYMK